MKPIAFMRLRHIDSPEEILKRYDPKNLIVEQKYDGFKMMASRDRGTIHLYSRNGKELSANAPSIVKRLRAILPDRTTVLGEIVYIIKGRQELGPVQSILHSGSASRAVKQAKELGGRLEFVVYDCLEIYGKNISNLPWSLRRAELDKLIPYTGVVRRSKIYPLAKRDFAIGDSITTGGEGIVIKSTSSPYVYGTLGESEPHGQWWKFKIPGKKSHTEDVILLGYEKRQKRLAFKMYQLDHYGKRIFVGYISNLPRETEKSVQRKSDNDEPVVAEISHQERLPSGKFRHPGWIRLRPDKPLRSATMTSGKRSGMPKIKKEASSSSEFQNAVDMHLGRSGGRIQNPRRSKVKEALAAEAIRFSSFDEFARAYWDACARGIYWHPTDEKRFQIEEHERRLIESGRFNIYCSPELALKNKNKKYVAELDVTRLPADSIRMKRGSDGSEIKIVGAPGSVKVTRVLDADAAARSFQWQLSILPSSKEGLRLVWEKAWGQRRKESEKQSIKLKKEKERGERRAEAKRERERAYALRQAQQKLAAAKEVKAERAEKGRQARGEAQRREKAERESSAAAKKVQRELEKLEKVKSKAEREKTKLEKVKKAEREKIRIKKEKAQADKLKSKVEREKARAEKAGKSKSPKKKGVWKRIPTPGTVAASPNPSKIRRVSKRVNRLGKGQ